MVCALVPVCGLFITRLEVRTGNLRKLETRSHQLWLWHPHLGWWDPEHPRDQSECCTCRGRGTGLSCTLAVHSGSVTRSQWTENVKLNKTYLIPDRWETLLLNNAGCVISCRSVLPSLVLPSLLIVIILLMLKMRPYGLSKDPTVHYQYL